jgi:hypothetical protein
MTLCFKDKFAMEKQIREIIAQHIGGTYEAKQKCSEEIFLLFSVVDSLPINKDYSKLFKEEYNEEPCNGSMYPSLYFPEAMFNGEEWLLYGKICDKCGARK